MIEPLGAAICLGIGALGGWFVHRATAIHMLTDLQSQFPKFRDMIKQSAFKLPKPRCTIVEKQMAWWMEVDGLTVSFTGTQFAEYLALHYFDLGYEVILNGEEL